ncbi:hypothetical protein CABS01_11787 [Colletotrichum abscissum]|uniref:Chromo domain-containing protein n=1 Tax=Colletotrichum abscissum TaxID=1671311 RepID=A0A9P9X9V4_9PEZI|nr:uncharacterized protein CABS01_11787 [Colletotrichum abscissum]KAI3545125.1 hypothetical protein CABS02_09468 [Colletotrichum abscissum]KAK1492890.1 hypothetical protein CABS01_11787 [Colletotrichum abscissum]
MASNEQQWELRGIVSHRRKDPLSSPSGDNADRFEFEILWETGEKTWEPEISVQEDAPSMTFEYWEGLGGRSQFMENADYWIPLAIVRHRLQKESPNDDEEYFIQTGLTRKRTLENQRVRASLKATPSGRHRKSAKSARRRRQAAEENDVFVEDYADDDVDDDYQP